MRSVVTAALCVLLIATATACSSTQVNMAEPRRIVGTENAVRVDAQVAADQVAPGAQVPITYEITNQRPTPIAIAELIPETSYDTETRTFTVSIGAEVPGNSLLPRLVKIEPGEKRTFSVAARLIFVLPPRQADAIYAAAPAALRLKVNFLNDVEPFRELIGIKEVAVADPQLADTLFPLWLDHNEAVYTNAIPMRWGAKPRDPNAQDRAPVRRRGN